jgi:hypothetical protein
MKNTPKEDAERTVQEDALTVGKTWSEMKTLAVDRQRWKNFTDVLYSSGIDRNE